MKIAIPTAGGVLCAHFGHCEQFYFAEIENKKVIKETFITPPAHEPGLYPQWVKEQGCDLVIGGGMGQKAQDLFAQNQLSVIVGASYEEPRKVIDTYLKGTLQAGSNSCDH